MSLETIAADFELLDDWEDRYRYVIDLGKAMAPLPEAARSEANKVRGCVSQVWLVTRDERAPDGSPVLAFDGDSDALIVRGLIAILIATYSGKPAAEILAIEPRAIFARLGLAEHLSRQRSNGLNAMVERVRADAERALAASRR